MKEKWQNLFLALVISIILTLLLLSTYWHSYSHLELSGDEIIRTKSIRKGVFGLIEDILDNNISFTIISLIITSILLFCVELIVSYFIIVLLRKKLKQRL